MHWLTNNRGVILVMTIVLSIAMMIITIGVISANYTQTINTKNQVERIKAEELAKGAAWVNYMNLSFSQSTAMPTPVTLDGKTYSFEDGTPDAISDNIPSTLDKEASVGPNTTDRYRILVSY